MDTGNTPSRRGQDAAHPMTLLYYEEPSMTTMTSPAAVKRANILIVEDDPLTSSHLKIHLEALGHAVCRIVHSAVEAIMACEELRPNLVLMDIVLAGDHDGIDAAEVIHSKHKTPVIYVTTYASDELITRACITNPFGYILKPFTERELAVTLELALYRHERDQKLNEILANLSYRHDELAAHAKRLDMYTAAIERVRGYDKTLQISGDLNAFFNNTIRELMALTNAHYGAMGNFTKNGELAHLITVGIDDKAQQNIDRLPTGRGVLGAFYHNGTIRRIDDIASDPASCGLPHGHPSIKSLLGLPLQIDGRTTGVLYLARNHESDPFSADDEQIARLYASQIEYILERHTLHHDLLDKNQALDDDRKKQAQLVEKLQNAQQQLLQSEKMAAIGQLAAGVAHEINNPVGYIKSNLNTLSQYVENLIQMLSVYEQSAELLIGHPDLKAALELDRQAFEIDFVREDVRNLLRESNEGVARVKQIVQDLKEFSHSDEGEWQEEDIHKGLDSTLNIVWNELKYKADVIKEYDAIPNVPCIPSQLNQVFMNLLVNAAQAIEERGTITIRTRTEDDKWACIEIEDSGKGIAPENLGRIFEPFFTTKEIGKGTGLGLSISYGIISKHQGTIDVHSEIGRGTTFCIRLPLTHTDTEKATDYMI